MGFTEFLTTVVTPFGGAAVVIIILSGFLGKVWAARILEQDRKKYAAQIEELKARLQVDTGQEIAALENELSIFKEKELKSHYDKVTIYRSIWIPVVNIIYDFEKPLLTGEESITYMLLNFNRNHLKAHAKLALFAPQVVLDERDRLIDFLNIKIGELKTGEYDVSHYQEVWKEFRTLAFALLNKVRADIGLFEGNVIYRGDRV
jgi:hypothetical protein